MGYEKFIKRRRMSKTDAMVSIHKSGLIAPNRVCFDKYFCGYDRKTSKKEPFKHVILFFDAKNNKIGIQPTNDSTDEVSNVYVTGKGKLGIISGSSFLSYYKISHKQSVSYPVVWNDNADLVEIALKQTKDKTRKGRVCNIRLQGKAAKITL